MSVYQVGYRFYSNENSFKRAVRNARGDTLIKVHEEVSSISADNFHAGKERSRSLERILEPTNDKVEAFRTMINREINKKVVLDPADRNAKWKNNARVINLERILDYDTEKELKNNIVKNCLTLLNETCQSVEDYLTVLNIHNFREFKFVRKYRGWNQVPSYEKVLNPKSDLFGEAKKLLVKPKKLRKNKTKKEKV